MRAARQRSARLRAVRVRIGGRESPSGRHPRAGRIEIEYDVLQPGHVLLPHFTVHTPKGRSRSSAFEQ